MRAVHRGSPPIPTLGCRSSGGNLYSLPWATTTGAVAPSPGTDATASGAFDAHIEQNHMMVTIVTLTCAGRCADVEAVATGGQPSVHVRLGTTFRRARRARCVR